MRTFTTFTRLLPFSIVIVIVLFHEQIKLLFSWRKSLFDEESPNFQGGYEALSHLVQPSEHIEEVEIGSKG